MLTGIKMRHILYCIIFLFFLGCSPEQRFDKLESQLYVRSLIFQVDEVEIKIPAKRIYDSLTENILEPIDSLYFNQSKIEELSNYEQQIISESINSTFLPDQILPIDLTFLMVNEYGNISRMALYGVEFLNNGQTMSIEDLLLEEVVQFVALDMDPLADITDKATSTTEPGERSLSASDVFKAGYSSYEEWLRRVGLRRGF